MTTTIRPADIRFLRTDAAEAGDMEQVRLCDLALTLSDLRAEAEADDAGVEDCGDDSGAYCGETASHHGGDFARAPIAIRLAAAQRAWDLCVAAIRAAEAQA